MFFRTFLAFCFSIYSLHVTVEGEISVAGFLDNLISKVGQPVASVALQNTGRACGETGGAAGQAQLDPG